ncbi:threonine dehydratase [Hwanghaeella sp.]|uniref:threonine dehydratase n=1 Tax=Hwanghaeella sp. TaxID=2605943 RepID=UPI003CCB8F25
MTTVSKQKLEEAADLIYGVFKGTPQYNWPLLSKHCGLEVWVKHENHTPIGAFKVRGGLVFIDDYRKGGGDAGVITATRGNHGQSIALAAARAGIKSTIVVPEGNSVEKNAAMKAFGAELVVHGHDFQASAEYAMARAQDEKLAMVPSFDSRLVQGVGTYGMEFFANAPELDRVYVPIGLGSGICGVVSARDALGLKTKVYGVVMEGAPAYGLSFKAGHPISTNSAETIADGMACRVPVPEAVETICKSVEDVVTVTDEDVRHAMRVYYTHTHNVAEGAGAAPLAALLKDRDALQGKRAGVVLSGGNVDMSLFMGVLSAADPAAAPEQ